MRVPGGVRWADRVVRIVKWPRVKDLPEPDREPFERWLTDFGQTRPVLSGVPWPDQDGYYEWDYDRWQDGRPVLD